MSVVATLGIKIVNRIQNIVSSAIGINSSLLLALHEI